jgi:hypothetical protein
VLYARIPRVNPKYGVDGYNIKNFSLIVAQSM